MGTEKSAGIVLLRNDSGKNEFLLLNYPQGHWDFVKGKVEKNETPHETAIRETKEETGIDDIVFVDGFKEEIEYFFRANNLNIHKKVIFFLAGTNSVDVTLSHEHLNFFWLDYKSALKKLTYDNAINLLKKADSFLQN